MTGTTTTTPQIKNLIGRAGVKISVLHVRHALTNKSESSSQKFGFIKRVDKGEITTVKDLESWRFER